MFDQPQLTREYLQTQYVVNKKSQKELAGVLGVSTSTVNQYLASFGVPIREEEASSRKTYQVNEDFFKTWTPQMAWVLGLLYTDGHVEQGRRFCLTSLDIDMLKDVSTLLGFNGPFHRVQSKSLAERLTVSRKSMVDDLAVLGVTAAKTHSIRFPKIPRPFIRHFVRGCFDGDGGFFYDQNLGKLKAHFTSGSAGFMSDMAKTLCEHIGDFYDGKRSVVISPIKEQHRVTPEGKEYVSKPYQRLSITAQASLQDLYWFLYDGVPDGQCLRRKRETFEQYLADRQLTQIKVQPVSQALEL